MSFDWGSLIGAAVSLYSGSRGASAARAAGNAQQQGAQQANDLTKYMFDRSTQLNMPFYNTSVAANNQLAGLLGLPNNGGTAAAAPNYVSVDARGVPIANADLYGSDANYRNAWDSVANNHQRQYNTGYWHGSDRNWIQDEIASRMPQQQTQAVAVDPNAQTRAFDAFRNTPGYQFGMDQGIKATQASAAARGGLNSGATLKSLMKFGRDYSDAQGYRPYVSDLMQLSGNGQAMAGSMGAQGMNAAGMMGGNIMQGANARAGSIYASNQARQQGINDAAGFLGNWYGNRYGWGG